MNNLSQASSTLDRVTERGGELIRSAGPHIRDENDTGLRNCLRRDWSIGELAELLLGDDSLVSWVAAHCLSVIGGPVAVIPLARALHHDDPAVVSAAEDGLWRIWFDEAGTAVRRQLHRAAEALEAGRYDAARALLEDIIARHPQFAEAFNQRGLLRFFEDDHAGAIADMQRAVSLNRCHFGAYVGMGHAYAQLGHYQQALACYRRALAIHPRMEGVRQFIRQIQSLHARAHPVA